MGGKIKGSLIAALVVFIWGMLSWMVLPWHQMNAFENEAAVTQTLMENTSGAGSYSIPSDCENCEPGEPMAYVIFNPNGFWGGMPHMMIASFLIQFLAAFVAGYLICSCGGKCQSVAQFMAGLGLFAGITGWLPMSNWMGLPLSEALVGIADLVISWGLAGLVLSKFSSCDSAKDA